MALIQTRKRRQNNSIDKNNTKELTEAEKIIAQRIADKSLLEPNGCWVWKSCSTEYPYMQVKGKLQLAHRVSYKIYKGEIPKGYCVLRTCNNKKCVNPDHLFLSPTRRRKKRDEAWKHAVK